MSINTENTIYKVLKQFFDNQFSKDVEEDVQRWFISSSYSTEKLESTAEIWNSMNIEADMSVYKSLLQVKRKLGLQSPEKKKISLAGYMLRIAAVLLPLLIVIGSLVYVDKKIKAATPHLAQMIECSAPYGERKEVTLPDNTQVWLNSGSTIRYPEKFADNERIINLSGEAYFAVAKDSVKPFKVETSEMLVQALGTEFNVEAYPDRPNVAVILTKGSIKIETPGKKEYLLEPSQKLTLHSISDSISIEVYDENDLAWRTGQLVFNEVRLISIVQQVEEHFMVSIGTDKPITHDKDLYTVKFTRNDSLTDVLHILNELVPGVHFRKISQ